jgi:hypothetical protein
MGVRQYFDETPCALFFIYNFRGFTAPSNTPTTVRAVGLGLLISEFIMSYLHAGTSDRNRRLAEEAYELTDDNFASDLPETLSTFRS